MKRDKVKSKQEFVDWVNLFNGKMNCYTTVYDFEHWATDDVVLSSVIRDRMFLDFDAHDEPLENAHKDFCKVATKLYNDGIKFQMFFSGKGFHIIVYGEIANDIRSIQAHFSDLAKDYHTLDNSGIQTNRLRRIPNTVNLSSEGPYYCIPLSFEDINLGLDVIIAKAYFSQPTKMYGDKLQTWKDVKPIEVANIEVTPPKSPGNLPILPCLYGAIMVENPGHYARVYLAQWYRDILAMGERELPLEQQNEIVEVIMSELETIASRENVWLDWHKPTTRRYVKGIVSNGYHAPGCKSVLIPQGYCPGKCWRYCE